jgi:UDP-N-acetylmuramyl pentapeptide phosphotransferase/UDP-N-acetylglucosamine-1-phosphate transferase
MSWRWESHESQNRHPSIHPELIGTSRALTDLLLAFVLSVFGVGATLRYTRRAGPIDVPNERSSHNVPTPSGGGVAVIAAVFAVAAYDMLGLGHVSRPLVAASGVGLVGLAVVGWLDDHDPMPISIRLLVHFLAGCGIALLVNELHPHSGAANLLWLAWWVIWTMASINIVNFMDGIDGIVTCQGIVYGIFLFALLPAERFGSRIGLILAAACFGFLIWNWFPAKTFLGDVGSGPLGMLFVIGGALALQGAPPVLVFLPLFPLYLDALMTLAYRLGKGEDLTVAHRSHLYQRIANAGVGHPIVTLSYALVAAVGAAIAVAVNGRGWGPIIAAVAVYVAGSAALWSFLDKKWPHLA